MPCALTQDYDANGCKTGPAGIKRVLISEFANKNTQTIANGAFSAIALQSTTLFREYVLHTDTAPTGFWSDDLVEENGSYAYNSSVEFDLRSLSATHRMEVLLLVQNTVMIIVERNDGTYNMFGYNNGMNLKSATANSGTGWTDFKGQKLRFEGRDGVPAYEVPSGLIAALLTAAP